MRAIQNADKLVTPIKVETCPPTAQTRLGRSTQNRSFLTLKKNKK